jgi:hypothetical protein
MYRIILYYTTIIIRGGGGGGGGVNAGCGGWCGDGDGESGALWFGDRRD